MYNQDESIERFNNELNRVRKFRSGGYKGTSLDGDYWPEVSRKHAVKLGNIHKKRFGIHPIGFDELKKGRI